MNEMEMPDPTEFPTELMQLMLQGADEPMRVPVPSEKLARALRARLYSLRTKLKRRNSPLARPFNRVAIRILQTTGQDGEVQYLLEVAPQFHDLAQLVRDSGVLSQTVGTTGANPQPAAAPGEAPAAAEAAHQPAAEEDFDFGKVLAEGKAQPAADAAPQREGEEGLAGGSPSARREGGPEDE